MKMASDFARQLANKFSPTEQPLQAYWEKGKTTWKKAWKKGEKTAQKLKRVKDINIIRILFGGYKFYLYLCNM